MIRMKKTNKTTANWNDMDEINSEISTALKDIDGNVITAEAIAIGEDVIEQYGGEQPVATIRTEDGEYYSTISKTAIRVCEKLIGVIDNSGKIQLKISIRKTRDNNNFIAITALQK